MQDNLHKQRLSYLSLPKHCFSSLPKRPSVPGPHKTSLSCLHRNPPFALFLWSKSPPAFAFPAFARRQCIVSQSCPSKLHTVKRENPLLFQGVQYCQTQRSSAQNPILRRASLSRRLIPFHLIPDENAPIQIHLPGLPDKFLPVLRNPIQIYRLQYVH